MIIGVWLIYSIRVVGRGRNKLVYNRNIYVTPIILVCPLTFQVIMRLLERFFMMKVGPMRLLIGVRRIYLNEKERNGGNKLIFNQVIREPMIISEIMLGFPVIMLLLVRLITMIQVIRVRRMYLRKHQLLLVL